jgi:O-antigen ligase
MATLVFRVDPALEIRYLRSQLAAMVMGKAAERLFDTGANNVLDPSKSGGLLFPNANVNSMFLGVSAFAMVVLFARTRSRLAVVVGVGAFFAVFATGSKTGLILAVVLPVVFLLLQSWTTAAGRRFAVPAAVLVLILAFVVARAVTDHLPQFSDTAADSAGYRSALWTLAATIFPESPLFGLGYGGWMPTIQGLSGWSLPPHNFVVAAWADGGLVLALATVGFAITALAISARALFVVRGSHLRAVVPAAACAVLWVMAHGMFDNTTLYGEAHSMIVVAAMLGTTQLVVSRPTDGSVEPSALSARPIPSARTSTIRAVR